MRMTIADLAKAKRAGRRIAMLTVYDHAMAVLAERAGLRLLLVGDSLGMVVQGHETTLSVQLEDMVRHAAYVARGARASLVVADLPFLSYATPQDAVTAARRLLQEGGVQAVKLEGGAPVVDVVRRLVELGVPVMGHLGYTPQSTLQIGLGVQGKDARGARALLDDALALEAAGAFAIVLELVPAPLAQAITSRLRIPTIGIGAGPDCDGQVQVWHDVLGLSGGKPLRHAKLYADVGGMIETALRAYAEEVETGTFPTAANSSAMSQDVLREALAGGSAD